MKQLLIILLVIFIISCNNKRVSSNSSERQVTDTALTEAQLISHVKLAINPKFENWVLFTHGTYIILRDSLANDKRNNAIKIMREFGPVQPGTPSGDFSVIHLHKTDGWVVSADFYGMYTYVHTDEMARAGIQHPSDLDIGYYGRNKRKQDAEDLKIIYINQ